VRPRPRLLSTPLAVQRLEDAPGNRFRDRLRSPFRTPAVSGDLWRELGELAAACRWRQSHRQAAGETDTIPPGAADTVPPPRKADRGGGQARAGGLARRDPLSPTVS